MTIRDEYPAAHVRLLHELFAIYRAGTNPYHDYGYGYSGYGHDLKHIDLAACESRQLWNLLDEAVSVRLPLVYPHKMGEIPPTGDRPAMPGRHQATRRAGRRAACR